MRRLQIEKILKNIFDKGWCQNTTCVHMFSKATNDNLSFSQDPSSSLPRPDQKVFFPHSPPDSDEEQDEPFGSDEGGEFDMDSPPTGISKKRPIQIFDSNVDPDLMDDDDDVDIDIAGDSDQPDLEEYFSNWDIPWKEVVLICRSYASYVASRNKTSSAAKASTARVKTPSAPRKAPRPNKK